MTTIEEIWTYIDTNEPFMIHLSDGRHLLVKNRHWISAHPSRKGSSIRVFGPGEDEEHFIPVLAITDITNRRLSQ